MRRSIIFLICFASVLPVFTNAQAPLDYTSIGHARQFSFTQRQAIGAPLQLAKKWQLNTFGGISGGYGFFNHTNASMLSAPVTVQLSHPLTKNLYAFAAISAAPAYYNFGSSFLQPRPDKFSTLNGMMGGHQFGWYSRAEAGLFYINDEKTFSISGSIFMDRSSYPVYFPVSGGRGGSVKREP